MFAENLRSLVSVVWKKQAFWHIFVYFFSLWRWFGCAETTRWGFKVSNLSDSLRFRAVSSNKATKLCEVHFLLRFCWTKRFFTSPVFFSADWTVVKQSATVGPRWWSFWGCHLFGDASIMHIARRQGHGSNIWSNNSQGFLLRSPDFDPNLRALDLTVRIASARNVIISCPPHPTLKTRNLETFVKHDVISCHIICLCLLKDFKVSSTSIFNVHVLRRALWNWLCRAVVAFQGLNGEQPCCRHGQVGFAKSTMKRSFFFIFCLVFCLLFVKVPGDKTEQKA